MSLPPAKLLVVAGPTAVGKTEACIRLAGHFNAEIIGADSVQIYRGLDIGSAKPTPGERARAPHHLVDFVDPAADFSAADYVREADRAIAAITSRGKRCLVAGGTGLYIRALLHGLAPAPAVDPDIRAALAADWERLGPRAMHDRLAQADPASAAKLHPNDRQRVLRALEFFAQTGEKISARQQEHAFAQDRYPHLAIGLTRPRPELAQRIAARCGAMFSGGLLEETRGLLAAGVPPFAKALSTLGYRQAVAHLAGEISAEEALAQTISQTKAYAKRQMTWFKKVHGIKWAHPDDTGEIIRLARRLFT